MEKSAESPTLSPSTPLGFTAEGLPFGARVEAPRPGASWTEVEPAEVIWRFKQHGAVLWRGFAASTEEFRSLTECFGHHFLSYPGPKRIRVGGDATLQTVDSDDRPIRLHSELSYLPLRPDLCWFYCVRPPSRDGQTLLCDGLSVVPRLSPETRQVLDKPLRYQAELTPELWRPLLGVDTVEQLAAELESRGHQDTLTLLGDLLQVDARMPALRKPLFVNGLAFNNNLIHTGRGVRGRLAFEDGGILPEACWDELAHLTEQLTVEVAWRSGDVLMVDNSRILHGRRRVEPGDGRLIYTRCGRPAVRGGARHG